MWQKSFILIEKINFSELTKKLYYKSDDFTLEFENLKSYPSGVWRALPIIFRRIFGLYFQLIFIECEF